MRWPWQREPQRGSELPPEGATVATPRTPPQGWAFLPPVQRILSPIQPVTRLTDLADFLPSWRNPSLSSRGLTHLVSTAAPAGVIDGDGGGIGSPQPRTTASPDLTLLPPPPLPVQRAPARTPFTRSPEVVGLPVLQRSVVQDASPMQPHGEDMQADPSTTPEENAPPEVLVDGSTPEQASMDPEDADGGPSGPSLVDAAGPATAPAPAAEAARGSQPARAPLQRSVETVSGPPRPAPGASSGAVRPAESTETRAAPGVAPSEPAAPIVQRTAGPRPRLALGAPLTALPKTAARPDTQSRDAASSAPPLAQRSSEAPEIAPPRSTTEQVPAADGSTSPPDTAGTAYASDATDAFADPDLPGSGDAETGPAPTSAEPDRPLGPSVPPTLSRAADLPTARWGTAHRFPLAQPADPLRATSAEAGTTVSRTNAPPGNDAVVARATSTPPIPVPLPTATHEAPPPRLSRPGQSAAYRAEPASLRSTASDPVAVGHPMQRALAVPVASQLERRSAGQSHAGTDAHVEPSPTTSQERHVQTALLPNAQRSAALGWHQSRPASHVLSTPAVARPSSPQSTGVASPDRTVQLTLAPAAEAASPTVRRTPTDTADPSWNGPAVSTGVAVDVQDPSPAPALGTSVLVSRATTDATEVPLADIGTAAGQADAPAGGSAAAGGNASSPEQVEALAQRLLQPLLRRIRAELLLDRERRGLRTDSW